MTSAQKENQNKQSFWNYFLGTFLVDVTDAVMALCSLDVPMNFNWYPIQPTQQFSIKIDIFDGVIDKLIITLFLV